MKNNLFGCADILLPKKDFEKWAVIACDQFTSDLSYWEQVKECAANAPSALNLILPEIYLSEDDTEKINKINCTMREYLASDVFTTVPNSMIYVERRQRNGKVRRGIVGAVDLEAYDYRKGSKTPIRATEETVPDRLPPRIAVRREASLELPHVMLLIDDPENKVIGSLTADKGSLDMLYDFDLMMKGGHLSGYRVDCDRADKLCRLLGELSEGGDSLLFAVGDGNHSLATAKECYLSSPTPENRYALVEVVNLHDESLVFEPIYRILFGISEQALTEELTLAFGELDSPCGQSFTMISEKGERALSLKALSTLPVGTLQLFINDLCKKRPEVRVDYVHEIETVKKLSAKPDTVGFVFEGMKKSELFTAVTNDGALPRKTFSMGEGCDKRYYVEAKKIK